MSQCQIDGIRVAGIASCVPSRVVENSAAKEAGFTEVEIRKVSSMAGIKRRHVADVDICSTDLCYAAAEALFENVGWERDSIDALIFVTQSPDYFLPSSSCLVQHRLGLSDEVASFDVGLGCSGYPYGLYLASTMIRGSGFNRVLLLHGETPSRFTSPDDRATTLLFGDSGSATAIEADATADTSHFVMHTDGSGADGLIIPGGGFRNPNPEDPRDNCVQMDGAGIFNFTIKRVPPLIDATLKLADQPVDNIDYYIFHQSNQFIIKHLMKKCGLAAEAVPLCLEDFGNTGGASIPLTLTQATTLDTFETKKSVMLLGYGVGLSWASALITLQNTKLCHVELDSSGRTL